MKRLFSFSPHHGLTLLFRKNENENSRKTFSRLENKRQSFSSATNDWANLLVSLALSSWTFCRENELYSFPGSWDTEILELEALGSNLAKFRRLRKCDDQRMLIFGIGISRENGVLRSQQNLKKMPELNQSNYCLPLLPRCRLLATEARWDDWSGFQDRLGMIMTTTWPPGFQVRPRGLLWEAWAQGLHELASKNAAQA